MLAQITWGYSFEFTSNCTHIYSYPLSPGKIVIDCTSKSNEKCNVVSGKFHLRLLIWQIEEIDARKLRIWGLSISGVFYFFDQMSHKDWKWPNLFPSVCVDLWWRGPFGSPLIKNNLYCFHLQCACRCYNTTPGEDLCAVSVFMYFVFTLDPTSVVTLSLIIVS